MGAAVAGTAGAAAGTAGGGAVGTTGGGAGAAAGNAGLAASGLGALFELFRGLFGRPVAQVPADMRGLRQQHIDLLHQFLMQGAFGAGGAGRNYFYGGADPNAPTPETGAFNTARPFLESMLSGSGPQFEHDIGLANQQGARFSSGNEILRGEALRHLFNQRDQTAQTLGMLAHGAGQSQFERQNQLLQLLAGLFGSSGQATMSLPITQKLG